VEIRWWPGGRNLGKERQGAPQLMLDSTAGVRENRFEKKRLQSAVHTVVNREFLRKRGERKNRGEKRGGGDHFVVLEKPAKGGRSK